MDTTTLSNDDGYTNMVFTNAGGDLAYLFDLTRMNLRSVDGIRKPELGVYLEESRWGPKSKYFAVNNLPAAAFLIEGSMNDAQHIINNYISVVGKEVEKNNSLEDICCNFCMAWPIVGENKFLLLMGDGGRYNRFGASYQRSVQQDYKNKIISIMALEEFYIPKDFSEDSRLSFFRTYDLDWNCPDYIELWNAMKNNTKEVYDVLMSKQQLEENIKEGGESEANINVIQREKREHKI